MEQKKKPLLYTFHCRICGAKMHTSRKDVLTCSIPCRVALSAIMRYGEEPVPPEPLTDEQKNEVEEKIAEVKGEAPTQVEKLIGVKKTKKEDGKEKK